ncbi:hypothetical protein Thimo_2053 [Thioflavicoccus mobilis 8321]|uniref:Uncharacterized protein n=1 Tax=Thioflavicoccus mobilis 8321 TaxID=765912 RepID=L0GYA6_9GAMM|nr:hypothetical protein [Thioflavicoccus mobilis]AGA90807.1 hypothetical protein Thimo_2053 [Thioflavicoccus mobilis 8321]
MNQPRQTQESTALLDHLDPQTIQRRLGPLMRRYLSSRSAPAAHSVARHIEALCCHPDFFGTDDERCVYLRLVRQWRWLADQGGAQPSTARPADLH